MPHGTPDWWGVEPSSTIHQVQDAGELAVRVGSIVSYDRRGNVIFLDDFEDGLARWGTATSGLGAGVTLSADAARSRAYSVKLTGGSDDSRFARLSQVRPIPVEGKIGVEVSFTNKSDLSTFEIHVAIDDRTNIHRARVRFDEQADDFEYYDSAGVWQDIDADKPCYNLMYTFHTMKLVFDLSTDKYIRAMLNDEEYDLSAHSMQTAASGGLEQMATYIYVYSTVGNNTVSYVDDVIFTQNEP